MRKSFAKLGAVACGMALSLSLVGCGGAPSGGAAQSGDAAEETVEETAEEEVEEEPEEPTEVLETEHLAIEGIYIDDSYVDKDSDQLKMVYVFYTINATDENLEPASTSLSMTINEKNSYQAEHYPGLSKGMSKYYYSSFLEDVYVGDSLEVMSTFKIPKGDLEPGRSITFSHSSIEDASELLASTDIIETMESADALAQKVDPEGYAAEIEKMEEADEETTARVRAALNGYYWSFYVNSSSYKIEFFEPNSFDISVLGLTNSGTYVVRKGYVELVYPDTGPSVEIPYTWKEDGDIDLDVVTGFSVQEG